MKKNTKVAVSNKQARIIDNMFGDCWWIKRYMRMSIMENRIAGNLSYRKK